VSTLHSPVPASLDVQWAQFANRRFLAMPISGTIAWIAVGVAGAFLKTQTAAWVLFVATGSIFYLALLIAKLTGEDLLGRRHPGNFFDRIFVLTIAMAFLVFAISIPFFLVEPTSLPLSVGIATGLMWLPFSVVIRHWVGYFHAITRTLLIVAAWYLFPAQRFVVIPAIIVAVYLVTIWALATRRRELNIA
jgi:uncharacterized protein DUF7010